MKRQERRATRKRMEEMNPRKTDIFEKKNK